jgi:hypothetical protein
MVDPCQSIVSETADATRSNRRCSFGFDQEPREDIDAFFNVGIAIFALYIALDPVIVSQRERAGQGITESEGVRSISEGLTWS